MKSGHCEYSMGNGIAFVVNDDHDADDEGSFAIVWVSPPKELAKQLRMAADFLDAHAGSHINVDID